MSCYEIQTPKSHKIGETKWKKEEGGWSKKKKTQDSLPTGLLIFVSDLGCLRVTVVVKVSTAAVEVFITFGHLIK